ncbi:hypothetical protein ACMGGR_12775 [Erwinia sp. BNK-24-b]|uniref:hypothetical protein n=1 Tax=unclassified Erwinia TaxID=2622719 RepID=UPI0039BFD2F7
MKLLAFIFVLLASPSFAAISNPQKAAQDLCEMEWQITDKAMATDANISHIVDGEVKKFKNSGYSLSDFKIDETDFVKVSIEGAEGFRKMQEGMTTPYSEARSFFRQRMMPICIKNVLGNIYKDSQDIN